MSGEKPILSVLMKVAKKEICHKHAVSLKPTYQTQIFWAGQICLLSHYTSFSSAHIIKIPYEQSLSVSLHIIVYKL